MDELLKRLLEENKELETKPLRLPKAVKPPKRKPLEKKVVEKKERFKLMPIKDILKLNTPDIIPTILKQNRGQLVEKQFLKSAMREIFARSREKFTVRVANNLMNNIEYLLAKHEIRKEEMDEFIKSCTFQRITTSRTQRVMDMMSEAVDSPIELSLLIGFSFNIDHEFLMYNDLATFDSKNLVPGFKYFDAEFEHIKKARKLITD